MGIESLGGIDTHLSWSAKGASSSPTMNTGNLNGILEGFPKSLFPDKLDSFDADCFAELGPVVIELFHTSRVSIFGSIRAESFSLHDPCAALRKHLRLQSISHPLRFREMQICCGKTRFLNDIGSSMSDYACCYRNAHAPCRERYHRITQHRFPDFPYHPELMMNSVSVYY